MTIFCFSVSSSVVHLDVFLVISYMRTHVVDISLHQAIDRSRRHHTTCLTDPDWLYCGKTFGSGAQFPIWSRSSLVIETMTLFSGLGTDVHFSGDETGLQWEDYLFELQNAVEWRKVVSRGQDERSQMHAMKSSFLQRMRRKTSSISTDGIGKQPSSRRRRKEQGNKKRGR